jgi:hypothetical protein
MSFQIYEICAILRVDIGCGQPLKMTIRTNKIMDEILRHRSYDFIQKTVTLPPELEKLVNSGFRTEKDCILLKNIGYFRSGIADSDFKKTEYEDFENHIHADDYTSGVNDEFEYLKAGLEFAKRLYKKLDEAYPSQFRIIVSYDESTYEEQEIETYGSCVVRFYMIRPSCDKKFRVDDLDIYETGGVLVIE